MRDAVLVSQIPPWGSKIRLKKDSRIFLLDPNWSSFTVLRIFLEFGRMIGHRGEKITGICVCVCVCVHVRARVLVHVREKVYWAQTPSYIQNLTHVILRICTKRFSEYL